MVKASAAKTTAKTAPKPTTPSRSLEANAIYAAAIASTVAFIIGVIAFWSQVVPLFGRGYSLGFVASIVGAVVALVVYLASSEIQTPRGRKSRVFAVETITTIWSLAVVYAAVAFLLYAGGFFAIQSAFFGVSIDMWAASTILAVSAGLVAYATYLAAAQMNALRVSAILAIFLVSGTMISMLTASDPYWWETHFSSLGASGGVSGYAFNATLIIAGIVIAGLSKFIVDDFAKLEKIKSPLANAKINILQIVLTLIGIFLAFVGLFVYDAWPFMHNTSAGGMAILFIGLILGLPYFVPNFSKAFFLFSYSLMAALVVCYVLFDIIGYFNLTVFEMIAAGIIFGWLVVFVRQIAAAIQDNTDQSKPALN